jgi:(p)ppGpp synthase/HD superfamily hydrolase
MPTLEDALHLAIEAHRGKEGKYGGPMILHPLRVMARVTTETERVVAILHDVVENSDLTLQDLRTRGYPEEVVEAIDHLTHRPGESYEAFTRRVKPHPLARRVKLADLEDNMDVRLIPQLDEDAVERLERYRRAWRILTEDDRA